MPTRLRFDNPDHVILPGQFLRLELTIGTTRAVLVPQRATSRASDGTLDRLCRPRRQAAVQVTLNETGTL